MDALTTRYSLSRDHNVEDLLEVIRLIPSDWAFVHGELHAPIDLIRSGVVSLGVLWNASGRTMRDDTLGYGITNHSVKYCSKGTCGDDYCHFHPISKDAMQKFARTGKPEDIVIHEKLPCGLSFNFAGAFTGEENLDGLKMILRHFIQLGYIPSPIGAYSGNQVGCVVGRQKLDAVPSTINSPQSMMLFYNPNTSTKPFVEVSYLSPHINAGRANLLDIIDGLEEIGFREVSLEN